MGFTEEEIEKGVYSNFYKPQYRIGYEIQFDSILPMMSDDIKLTKLNDGEYFMIDGIVKDGVAKYILLIMDYYGYLAMGLNAPEKTKILLTKGKILTLSVVKLIVFELISNSPFTVNDGGIIDKKRLHSLLINIKTIMKTKEFKDIDFIGNMFNAAIRILLRNTDDYNKRLISDVLN